MDKDKKVSNELSNTTDQLQGRIALQRMKILVVKRNSE